jgi:UDP-glucose 4-epimerase
VRILVTGGAGFIGSHIVDALIDNGHRVVVVDNLSSGFRENINPKAKFYELDICDDALAEVFETEKPDIINHHAAQMDVRKSVEDPVFDAQQNILGSLNVINCSLANKVKKIIYASTGGAIYGEPDYVPADEDNPINPICQYGVSKHTVEHYLHLYWHLYGLKYTVLRYGNVYGPRQNPKGEAGVVAIFIGQLLNGIQPVIFGKGDKIRDYVYIDDIVKANLIAIERGDNRIYNIGTGVPTTDQQVYDTIANAIDSKMKPTYEDVRPGEINRVCLDNSRAKEDLGWEPTMGFDEGVKLTVKYFQIKNSH